MARPRASTAAVETGLALLASGVSARAAAVQSGVSARTLTREQKLKAARQKPARRASGAGAAPRPVAAARRRATPDASTSAPDASSPVPATSDVVAVVPEYALSAARAELEYARSLREETKDEPVAVRQFASREVRAAIKLVKDCEKMGLSEAHLLKTPQFERIVAAVVDELQEHPDIARRVVARLDAFDQEGGK